nr:MAG: capsid protein [Cressdnaviricota sp.]
MNKYETKRAWGGKKGLGRGMQSYGKGYRRGKIAQQAHKPNSIVNVTKRYSVNRGGLQEEVRTVDHTFEVAYVNPYVPDILAKTELNATTTLSQQALLIQQGPGVQQRLASKTSLKSCRLRFKIKPTGNAVLSPSMMRLMLVYDRSPNQLYGTSANILSNVNEAGSESAFDPFGDINVINFDRFIVLMDEYRQVPPTNTGLVANTDSTGATDLCVQQIDRYINLRGLEQTYVQTSSPMVIANQSIGALLLLSMGDIAAGSEPYAWYGKCRLRFKDN